MKSFLSNPKMGVDGAERLLKKLTRLCVPTVFLLLGLLLFDSSTQAQDIVVSQSSCGRLNGNYSYRGASNEDRKMFELTTDLNPALVYMWYYEGAWRIYEYPNINNGSKDGGITHYVNYSNAQTPPCAGWIPVGSCSSAIEVNAGCNTLSCTPPVIAAHPKSYTGFLGARYDLTVATTGANISYEWQVSTNNVDFSTIGGTNVSTLDINLYEEGTKYYRCVVREGDCYTLSQTATVVTLGENDPVVYTNAVRGLSRAQVAILVRVSGFAKYSTLQGNISLPAGVIARIDSVVVNPALSGINGLAGDVAVSGTTISYSYDNLNGEFSLPNQTPIFTVYAHLVQTSQTTQAEICGLSVSSGTSHQWGRLVNGAPIVTKPSVLFDQVCVEAAEQNSITFGTFPRICAGENKVVSIPFEAIGAFSNLTEVNLLVDGEVRFTGPLADGSVSINPETISAAEHTLQIVAEDGTFSNQYTLNLGGFEAPQLFVNGAPYTQTSDPNTFYCPNSILSAEIKNAGNISWSINNFSNSDTNKVFSVNTYRKDSTELLIRTVNALGCLNPNPEITYLRALDKIAPVISIRKISDTLHFAPGALTGIYNLYDIVDITDNCGLMTVIAKNKGEACQPDSIVLSSGRNVIEIDAVDSVGNSRNASVEVYGSVTPVYNFTWLDSASTDGVNEKTVVLCQLMPGAGDYVQTFSTASGKIYLGRFAKQVLAVKPIIDAASVNYSFAGDTLSYELTNLVVQGNKPALLIALKPNMALGSADENYKAALAETNWVTEYGKKAIITSSFQANTLNGLAVISGAFVKPDGSPFSQKGELICDGCVKNSSYSPYKEINVSSLDNSFNFRAVPGTPLRFNVIDRSGAKSTSVNSTHVVNNRRYILNQIQLDTIYSKAGDVDNSGDVNTLDVLQQRQNIVGDLPVLRNNFGERSAFNYLAYDKDLQTYPLVTQNFTAAKKTYNYDFITHEVGVVNSVPPKSGASADFNLAVSNVTGLEQSLVKVPVVVTSTSDAAGLQFTVQWNSSALDFTELSAEKVPFLLGKSELSNGYLMMNWVDDKAMSQSFKAGDTLFVMNFLTSGKSGGATAIEINSSVTRAMGSDEFGRELSLNATEGSVSVATSIKDLGNGYGISNAVPNPFTGECLISFVLPVAEELTFTVYNELGQFISETKKYEAGAHSWFIPANDNMNPGVYFVNLQSKNMNQVVKVVKL